MPSFGFEITKHVSNEDLLKIVEPAMDRYGKAVSRRAQRLVPTDTYALHDSIGYTVTTNGLKVVVDIGAGGGRVDYALYVEQGTSRQRAQPYLKPAMLQSSAADLKYGGSGPTTRGVVRTSRRS